MKKIILVFALAFGATTFAQEAQQMTSLKSTNKVKADNSPDSAIKTIVEKLELTDEQHEIFMDMVEKRKKADQEEGARMKKEYRVEEDKELEEKFRAILTPEQNKKFDKLKKELEKERKAG